MKSFLDLVSGTHASLPEVFVAAQGMKRGSSGASLDSGMVSVGLLHYFGNSAMEAGLSFVDCCSLFEYLMMSFIIFIN